MLMLFCPLKTLALLENKSIYIHQRMNVINGILTFALYNNIPI